MRTMKRLLALTLATGVGAQAAFAEVSIVDMSLESILNMQVSVASKKAERISEAPGIIEVITADEIRRKPHESLTDILRTVPGVTISEGFFGYDNIAIRGIMENNYNARTLFMINGAPISNSTVGTYCQDASVPIDAIDRIEIIRGPGSVMYGTGAFSGVINVITKKANDNTDVRLYGGSKNEYDGGIATGYKFGESQRLFVSVDSHQTKGFKAIVKDERGETAQMGRVPGDDNDYRKGYTNFFGNYGIGGFDVDLVGYDQKHDRFGLAPDHSTTGEEKVEMRGATMRYEKTLGGVNLKSMARFLQMDYTTSVNSFILEKFLHPLDADPAHGFDISNKSRNFGANVDAQKDITGNLSVLAGVEYEGQYTDEVEWKDRTTGKVSPQFSSFLRDYDTANTSLYSQVEYSPLAFMKLVGGLRYNENKQYGATTVPRASALFKLSDRASLKALYGVAYRNPTFLEKYLNTWNYGYGDPNLKPEKIETSELGLDMNVGRELVRFTVFNTMTDDIIGLNRVYGFGDHPAVTDYEQRGVSTDPLITSYGYGNGPGQHIMGSELEVRGELFPGLLNYSAGISYKQGKQRSDDSDILYLDKWSGTTDLTCVSGPLLTTLTVSYIGERKGQISNSPPFTGYPAGEDVTIPAQTLVNIKATYALMKNIDLALTVMNLFEQEVQYPETTTRYVPYVPGDSGRNIFGEVTYRF